MKRRQFLSGAAGAGLLGAGAAAGVSLLTAREARAADYRAIVVIHLAGGSDGNDVLIPLDAAYNDYTNARSGIALPRASIVQFPGQILGHTMGLNAALQPLMAPYQQGRLAFVVNAGPLIEPTTVAQVLAGTAKLPPFLGSHPEQTQYVMGWMGDEDQSGWGGRAVETLAPELAAKAPLMAMDSRGLTLVLGRRSRITDGNSHGGGNLGWADLTNTGNPWTQIVESMGRLQSPNRLEAEYARTFRGIFNDSTEIAYALRSSAEPTADFGAGDIGRQLRFLARVLPYYKSAGARRQIVSVEWGRFDTHAGQRSTSTENPGQDMQFAELAKALTAFDQTMQGSGMGNEIVTLVTSEFGRTLDPAAGAGTDHAWGNHWFALGNPVRGGQFYGQKFPRLLRGGVDDGDRYSRRGYWVPQISTDQVAADLLRWFGVAEGNLTAVLPNLANFPTRSVGIV